MCVKSPTQDKKLDKLIWQTFAEEGANLSVIKDNIA
jgi:hypothetical protein